MAYFHEKRVENELLNTGKGPKNIVFLLLILLNKPRKAQSHGSIGFSGHAPTFFGESARIHQRDDSLTPSLVRKDEPVRRRLLQASPRLGADSFREDLVCPSQPRKGVQAWTTQG